MALTRGTWLDHYEILESIGVGGMGEVYRAKDRKLGREVAIKVLREELTAEARRLQRFEREARSASALNHPNIIQVYDIGNVGTTSYIAMQLVEGKTLREMLSYGSLPIRKLLALATQMADALAKAHAAGIVHRDLKPENAMVNKDGFVKILDFGLAKLVPLQGEPPSGSATSAELMTQPGLIVGTAQYMAPEQARRDPVDHRSDQFSLGLILYEMATGQRAFRRETVPQMLAAIIEDEPPPIASLNPKIPSHFCSISIGAWQRSRTSGTTPRGIWRAS